MVLHSRGLSRFDGYSFTNHGSQQGLPFALVNDLLETRDGQYWVATGAGLSGFNPSVFLKDSDITDITIERIGTLGNSVPEPSLSRIFLRSLTVEKGRAVAFETTLVEFGLALGTVLKTRTAIDMK